MDQLSGRDQFKGGAPVMVLAASINQIWISCGVWGDILIGEMSTTQLSPNCIYWHDLINTHGVVSVWRRPQVVYNNPIALSCTCFVILKRCVFNCVLVNYSFTCSIGRPSPSSFWPTSTYRFCRIEMFSKTFFRFWRSGSGQKNIFLSKAKFSFVCTSSILSSFRQHRRLLLLEIAVLDRG